MFLRNVEAEDVPDASPPDPRADDAALFRELEEVEEDGGGTLSCSAGDGEEEEKNVIESFAESVSAAWRHTAIKPLSAAISGVSTTLAALAAPLGRAGLAGVAASTVDSRVWSAA